MSGYLFILIVEMLGIGPTRGKLQVLLYQVHLGTGSPAGMSGTGFRSAAGGTGALPSVPGLALALTLAVLLV